MRKLSRMGNPDSAFARLLVGYYGFIQAAHIVSIARAAILLAVSQTMAFPAAPPPGGWSPQTNHFLIAMGAADAVNAVVALVFVYGYFAGARWRVWLGTLSLTVSAYSAVIFTYGTIASGAWTRHPTGYLSIALVFIPVAFLIVLFNVWVATARLDGSLGKQ
jgi:hypothetical protein